LLIDSEIISFMVGDLYDLRGKRLLPLIRKFYDLELVYTFHVGQYHDLERDIQSPEPAGHITPVFDDIFQHYRHILTTWHSFMTEEDRKARDLVWKKKMAELEAQKDWGRTPQQPQITTSKRTSPKVGRNAPCPCGSGKKHKRCCWGK
jgi:hypothetical protein